ncbi:hypothetical protein KCU81_g6462, partial [Aureobasidium melanogenum]|uniref:Uncharacterized protein n=1 Tax=Aureobasidium melanogenum (strain CBS 110374) TaxID=1043003 RepID=A0A074VLB7_AURM1
MLCERVSISNAPATNPSQGADQQDNLTNVAALTLPSSKSGLEDVALHGQRGGHSRESGLTRQTLTRARSSSTSAAYDEAQNFFESHEIGDQSQNHREGKSQAADSIDAMTRSKALELAIELSASALDIAMRKEQKMAQGRFDAAQTKCPSGRKASKTSRQDARRTEQPRG